MSELWARARGVIESRPFGIGFVVLSCVACAAVGFMLGRAVAPPVVLSRLEVIEAKKDEETSATRRRTTTQRRETPRLLPTPDGGTVVVNDVVVVTRELEDVDTRKTSETERQARREDVPMKLPDWRVGLTVGAALGRDPAWKFADRMALQVTVERRILQSPFSISATGNTVGYVGVGVSADFDLPTR